MIEINLLPEGRRPAEWMPWPRRLLIFGGVLGFGIAAFLLAYLLFDYRRLQERRNDLVVSMNREQRTIDEIRELEREIEGFKNRRVKIDKLDRDRRVWAPILSMLCDDKVLPQTVWFRGMALKKGGAAARGRPAPYELDISGYARGLKETDPSLRFLAMVQSTRDFARNIQKTAIYKAEFEGRPTSPEAMQIKKIPDPGDVGAKDAPERALSFTMKLKLKTRGAPAGAGR